MFGPLHSACSFVCFHQDSFSPVDNMTNGTGQLPDGHRVGSVLTRESFAGSRPDERTPLIGSSTGIHRRSDNDSDSDSDSDNDNDHNKTNNNTSNHCNGNTNYPETNNEENIATQPENDVDPDEFDLLLTKSTSFTAGPLLGPESMETPLLRGERKYSRTRHGRPRVATRGAVFGSRRPSITSATGEAAEEVGTEDEVEQLFLGEIAPSHFWLIFCNVLALQFMSNFESTLMASSHPVITSYFNASNSASWLSTAFLLTTTAIQPLVGSLSDTIGRKTPYIFTQAILTAATLWCALARSMTSFIAARAVCGLGAGGVMTLGSIIVSDLVPIERRGVYQSYINVVYGVGSTLGAAMGGFMADYLGWRWEFGVQLPPLVLCIAISSWVIPADLGLHSRKKETVMQAMRSFDVRGSIVLTTAVSALILGLNLGGNVFPWTNPLVLAALALFAVSFPLFLLAELRATKPIMPLYLIRRSPHANVIFSNALAAFIMTAVIFNMPLFFQAVLLTSATTSGFSLIVITVVSSTFGTATGLLVTHTKRLKWPLGLGASGFLVGTVVLSSMRRGWPLAAYLLCLVPHSVGQGFQFPGTFLAILAASEQREQAVVTSTLILWRSIGMMLGISGSSLVVQNSLRAFLDRWVTDEAARQGGFLGGKMEVVEKVRANVEAVSKLKGLLLEQVVVSYEAAVRMTFECCVVVAVVSGLLLLPVSLPRLGSRKKHRGQL